MLRYVPILIASFASRGNTACRSFSLPRPPVPVRPASTTPSPSLGRDDVEAEACDVSEAGHRERGRRGRGAGRSRRTALATILSSAGLVSAGNPATADDEAFAPMNELTRQIRTSVVRGAQLIDKADGRWERFSDDLGLGTERNKPKRNVIDAGGNGRSKQVVRSQVIVKTNALVLNETLAYGFLKACDEGFISCLKSQQSQASITNGELERRIDATKQLVRKSFFSSPSSTPTPVEEFNFECYAHFKVFNEVLIAGEVPFPAFRKDFEGMIGDRLLRLVVPPTLPRTIRPSSNLTTNLQQALETTDAIANALQQEGLIAAWERSVPLDDDVEDFAADGTDLAYSLALDGDATLAAQLLLQELGYRLYPSFGRWSLQWGVARCFGTETRTGAGKGNGVTVHMDDYYMDPSYSTNPDLFEVKQVLLNIVIQRD